MHLAAQLVPSWLRVLGEVVKACFLLEQALSS